MPYPNGSTPLPSYTVTPDQVGPREMVDQVAEMPPTRLESLLTKMNQATGYGPFYNQLQTFMTENDKFNHNSLPPNALMSGYTFITRPKLCLHDVAVTKRSEFLPMNTDRVNTIGFASRCLLDTKFCRDSSDRAATCKLINTRSPFLTPLQNGLVGISGYPDPMVETVTTEAGFHSEDHTFVTGYNQMNKTYDLTLDVRDPQGGPIMAILFYWLLFMGYQAKGMMPTYLEDVVQRVLNYTVSIYRFTVDPSRRWIQHYSKATGCFLKSIPLGAFFNFSDSQKYVTAAGNFSVNFIVNKLEYNKPEILAEFNTLMRRYDPGIENRPSMSLATESNYEGLPYISTGSIIDSSAPAKPLEITFR